MNPEAREKLRRFVRTQGTAICNTPRSAELFLMAALGEYPEERELILLMLKHDLVSRMLSRAGNLGWDTMSDNLVSELKAKTDASDEQVRWAVDSWGLALGKHPEASALPQLVEPTAEQLFEQQMRKEKAQATAKMATYLPIVAAGGALGSGLGALVMTFVFVTFFEVAMKFGSASRRVGSRTTQAAMTQDQFQLGALIFYIISTGSGLVTGGLGAAGGWLVGKGDRKPWTAFSATFTTGFLAAALSQRFFPVIGLLIACPLFTFAAAMGAAYGSTR